MYKLVVSIALLAAVALPSQSFAADKILAQAENKAGGNIVLTETKCPPKDTYFGADRVFYTTGADGKKNQSGCYGMIPSALGPMVFVLYKGNLRVFPAGAFHSPTEVPKHPKIKQQDWL